MAAVTISKVKQILIEDAKYRIPGITGDLHKLCDINPTDWTFDEPTLTEECGGEYRQTKNINNISEFRKKFFEKYRIIDVDMSNLFIAGGAVKSVLLDKGSKDIDVFVYGCTTTADATKRVEKFILDIYNRIACIQSGELLQSKLDSIKYSDRNDALSQHNNETNRARAEAYKKDKSLYDKSISDTINITYNGKTITIDADNLQIQVILRLYKTSSEIIHGFDLGSSAVGFDGNDVYFTSLSRFCYENMVNIFDGTRRSTTYEYRLIKYFNDGFSIVLPHLDISRLRTEYFKYNLSEVCEMPYLTFSYRGTSGNAIYVSKFYNKFDIKSDYDIDIEAGDCEFKIPYVNLSELLCGKNRFIRVKTINDDLDPNQLQSALSLKFDDNIVKYNFVEWFYNHILKTLLKKSINFGSISRAINVVDIKDIIKTLYLSDFSNDAKENYLRELIARQKQWVLQKMNEIHTSDDITWMTTDPTTQLTSSFNPIITDPRDWYGKFYKN